MMKIAVFFVFVSVSPHNLFPNMVAMKVENWNTFLWRYTCHRFGLTLFHWIFSTTQNMIYIFIFSLLSLFIFLSPYFHLHESTKDCRYQTRVVYAKGIYVYIFMYIYIHIYLYIHLGQQ